MTTDHDPDHDPAGRERLVAALEPLGVEYELFACDPALADTAAFCAAYGFAPEESANTILVIGKSDPPRLRGLRRARAEPAGRQPDRSRSTRDAEGVVRPVGVDARDHRAWRSAA